jgi:hypothetical protein
VSEEATVSCVICHRRKATTGLVCDHDLGRVRGDLADIVILYAQLGDDPTERDTPWTVTQYRRRADGTLRAVQEPGHDPVGAKLPTHVGPRATSGQRVSGSREAPIPVRLEIVDLTLAAAPDALAPDRRGIVYADDQTGRVSIATTLGSWVRDWIDERGEGEHEPVPTVATLVGWLDARLGWACDRHPAVDEFATEIRELVGALRHAVGQTSDRMRLGPCPVMLDTGPCGAGLYGSPWVDIVECPRCATRWERRQWFVLGAAIQQAQAEAA